MFTTYPDHSLLLWACQVGLTRTAFMPSNERPASARPRHEAEPSSDSQSKFLVVCESPRGRAGAAGLAIARAAESRGIAAAVTTIDDADPDLIAKSEVLVAGCWMPGRAPFGDGPMRRLVGWIDSLPQLDGMPVGVFCTYRFWPHTFADVATRTAETERGLAESLERKGAVLVAKRAINYHQIEDNSTDLVESVLERVAA